ncbi:hypothetical protein DCC39_10445 [Pueribacillus theae]|uniref:Membrane protein YszA n=1 Tax=Pueribacillus theae TaxID=2171751 RepID=A0A2U1K159_9BACI|nr:hypothetical protein [Pueribacillus theae]PWA10703.1 hypothetical protein DCC39_10445 [Pueribacillus theae]
MFGRKKLYYRRLKYPPWVLTIRDIAAQVCLPLVIFQLIRTLFFPTALDVVLLLVFAAITLCLALEWF